MGVELLAPKIEEHKDSVNALCNHRHLPLEHRYIEPGLSSRAGFSMSNKRHLYGALSCPIWRSQHCCTPP